MAFKFDTKQIMSAVAVAFVIMTILNYLVHLIFPSVPILKTGFAIVLFLIGIVLTALFIFARDGNFSRDDMYGMILVIVIVVAIYFATKYFLPELFALVPDYTKEVFSFIG